MPGMSKETVDVGRYTFVDTMVFGNNILMITNMGQIRGVVGQQYYTSHLLSNNRILPVFHEY